MPSSIRLLVILFSLTVPLEAAAQHLPEALNSFRPGDRMRIRTLTHGLHIGAIVLIGADSVYLEPERGSRQVEIDAIDQMWSRGNASRTGATIGVISGGVVCTAFAALMTSAYNNGTVDPEITVKFGIAGALTGAIVGAAFGSLIGEWHSEYP